MTIPRDEKLKITQRVHAKWSEIYDDRDDVEANDAYFKMYEEAMAEAEEKYKDRPANSQGDDIVMREATLKKCNCPHFCPQIFVSSQAPYKPDFWH